MNSVTGPWPIELEELETAPAELLIGKDALGRFACGLCAENRDAGERAEREATELRAQLGRAHALLRLIARTEQRPAKREGIEDDPRELALVGFAMYAAAIKARIEIYFQAARGGAGV